VQNIPSCAAPVRPDNAITGDAMTCSIDTAGFLMSIWTISKAARVTSGTPVGVHSVLRSALFDAQTTASHPCLNRMNTPS